MIPFVDRVIAELDDDSGAGALKRFFAQVEYTAFWCIRMIRPNENIEAVAPESYEDVLIIKPQHYEQRQVKTRVESQGPWTIADLLPVYAKQYTRAPNLDRPSTFHFVSNGCSDTVTSFKSGGLGALYRLRVLLDGHRDVRGLTDDEKVLFEEYATRICPKLLAAVNVADADGLFPRPALTEVQLREFFKLTFVETDNEHVHYPNDTAEYCFRNLGELQDALQVRFPGQRPLTTLDLLGMYMRLILMIESRIRTQNTLRGRSITASEVCACRAAPVAIGITLPLNTIPGRTLMEKKARLGGFDDSRVQNIYRQRGSAIAFKRRLRKMDLQRLEELTTALLDQQITCRELICAGTAQQGGVGPRILHSFRQHVKSLAEKYFPSRIDLTDQICLGIIWDETDQCRAYWHQETSA